MNLIDRKALVGLALLLMGTCLVLGNAQANSVEKQNFAELMSHTDSIVIGTVSKLEDGFQQGLPFTEITIEVTRSVKGEHQNRFSFRQFGLIKPRPDANGMVNLMVTPTGWPTYAKGEQVMLFLHTPASRTGFQTTAGLSQGKFSIRDGQVANGLGNDSLFEGVNIRATLRPELADLVRQTGGAYQAEAFFGLVRQAVEENWIENGVMTDDN